MTIVQKLGEVTIEDRRARVVALDFPSADAAIALGVAPVGRYEVSYVEGGVQQWTKDALRGEQPELINTDQGAGREVFSRVPAVARGAFVPLDVGPATALAFPSVLSVPYAVDELVPQLATKAVNE